MKKKMMDHEDETKMNASNNKMLKMGVNKRRGKNHDVKEKKIAKKNDEDCVFVTKY